MNTAKALRRVRRALAGKEAFRPLPYGEKKGTNDAGQPTRMPVPRLREVRWRLPETLARKLQKAHEDAVEEHPKVSRVQDEESFALLCLDLGIETWARIEEARRQEEAVVTLAKPADMAKMSRGSLLGGRA